MVENKIVGLDGKAFKLSRRTKETVQALEKRGQDVSLMLLDAFKRAQKEGKNKIGSFGSARRPISQMVDHMYTLTQQESTVHKMTQQKTSRKERRSERRAKQKIEARERRRQTKSGFSHNNYS